MPRWKTWAKTVAQKPGDFVKVFTHLRQAQAFLAGANRLGCKVGLEKFGSGLDSFQLLAHFQPAFLKIDRSFTEDLSRAPEHQAKIR